MQLLLPQTVKQDLHFLVFTVHKCVDLPRMDYGALGIGQGIDAYVTVKFAGSQLKTKAVTVRGKVRGGGVFGKCQRAAAVFTHVTLVFPTLHDTAGAAACRAE